MSQTSLQPLSPDKHKETGLAAFYKELNTQERRTFWTCFTGWGLDALDFMIYPLVIGTIMTLWKVDTGIAGLAVTGTLLTSAIGGWLAGYLADRIGRVKTLQITVAWFCIFSIACRLRGSGQGFCYNFGRGMGALFPALVGAFSLRFGLATAIAIFAVMAYALLLVSAALLPETRGIQLDDIK